MRQPKQLVIIAGEESGDIHAAAIIRELTSRMPDLAITGIGGKHMQAAGIELIADLASFGVTGLTEVIRHLHVIRQAFQKIKTYLTHNKPDLLILVDYPGFNLRLAKVAHTLGIRVLYYISPQIWAWKPGRIHTIRKYVDHMAVILPFEKSIYSQAGINVSYVGHPLVKKAITLDNLSQTRQLLGIPVAQPVVALLPGSRLHEIERHMPVLCDMAKNLSKKYPNLHFVLPIARSISAEKIHHYLQHSTISYQLIPEQAVMTMACSDCVVVASGTASLECALQEKPMCIIYKASLLSYLIATKVIRVKYLGLCNLLANQMIAPELLQYDCNVAELTKSVEALLFDEQTKNHMIKKLQLLKNQLSSQQADCDITDLILQQLRQSRQAFPPEIS